MISSFIFNLNYYFRLPSNLLIQCSTLTQDGKDNIWTYISRIVENRDSYSDSLVQSSLEFMGTVIKELTQFVLLNKYNYKDYFVILDLWNQFCLSYSKMDIVCVIFILIYFVLILHFNNSHSNTDNLLLDLLHIVYYLLKFTINLKDLLKKKVKYKAILLNIG